MTFKDHFSHRSDAYQRYRPVYPRALFAYLASRLERCEHAWDCATGNGQAALALAEFFPRVSASDASAEQIGHALPHPRVRYRVGPAEDSGLAPRSLDLVTVAQALHWLALERFYPEVQRVLRPGGALAVWCYGLARIAPAVDAVVEDFYHTIVGPFWPPERALIETGYRTLPFPFREWQPPEFTLQAQWDLEHFLGYLGTWSAVRRYRERHGADPLALIRPDLARAWGDPERRQTLRWPLHLRVGYEHQ